MHGASLCLIYKCDQIIKFEFACTFQQVKRAGISYRSVFYPLNFGIFIYFHIPVSSSKEDNYGLKMAMTNWPLSHLNQPATKKKYMIVKIYHEDFHSPSTTYHDGTHSLSTTCHDDIHCLPTTYHDDMNSQSTTYHDNMNSL